MNPISPLTSAGSLADQGTRRKSTVYIIAFAAALHVVVLSGLLFLGCSKEDGLAGKTNGQQPSSATTGTAGEPVASAPAPITDSAGGAVAPVEAGTSNANTPAPAPATPPVVATPAPWTGTEPAPAQATEYKVVKGDIAVNIAKKNGVTLAALREANKGVDLGKLKVNQTIQVPPPAPKPVAAEKSPVATVGPADSSIHVVKSGDTLLRIARKHGTTVKALRAANSLTSDNIKAGQKLVIPAPTSAAATRAKAPTATASLPAAEPAAIPLPASNATEVPPANVDVAK